MKPTNLEAGDCAVVSFFFRSIQLKYTIVRGQIKGGRMASYMAYRPLTQHYIPLPLRP